MNEEDRIAPQAAIPPEILKQRGAITLYQIVVIALAVIGLTVVVGGIVLSMFDKAIPESVIVLGSIAVGGLVALVGSDRGQA